jgi:ribonuclease PH
MRIDGRKWDEIRPVTISPGYAEYAEGSALIEVGRTHVLCTATVEPSVPAWRQQSGLGWVTAEYAMLPRATRQRTRRETHGTGGRSHEIQRLVGRSLRAAVHLDRIGERTVILDCDVLQADGGTRTAAITGSYIALALALRKQSADGLVASDALRTEVAAISLGLVDGQLLLDLCYEEDSAASADFNVVMTGDGELVELQGTAEGAPFHRADVDALLDLAERGVRELVSLQRQALGAGAGVEA